MRWPGDTGFRPNLTIWLVPHIAPYGYHEILNIGFIFTFSSSRYGMAPNGKFQGHFGKKMTCAPTFHVHTIGNGLNTGVQFYYLIIITHEATQKSAIEGRIGIKRWEFDERTRAAAQGHSRLLASHVGGKPLSWQSLPRANSSAHGGG